MLAESFWDKIVVGDGCWGWSGSTNGKGYGEIRFRQRKMYAHRVCWLLHRGAIPSGLYVCHSCDNPGCTRPSHLFLGTAGENSQDMQIKGRHFRALQTRCKRGHEFTPENTKPVKRGRQCRICTRLAENRRYATRHSQSE
jgi:hypothetical protein